MTNSNRAILVFKKLSKTCFKLDISCNLILHDTLEQKLWFMIYVRTTKSDRLDIIYLIDTISMKRVMNIKFSKDKTWNKMLTNPSVINEITVNKRLSF